MDLLRIQVQSTSKYNSWLKKKHPKKSSKHTRRGNWVEHWGVPIDTSTIPIGTGCKSSLDAISSGLDLSNLIF